MQYVHWVGQLVFQGDFGTAYTFNNKPVLTLIGERFWGTIQLQAICAVPWAGDRDPGWDHLGHPAILDGRQHGDGRIVPRLGAAELLAGPAAAALARRPARVAAGAQHRSGERGFPEKLKYFVMPVIVLALPNVAYFARFMRSSMLEVIHQDYVTDCPRQGAEQQHGPLSARAAQRPDPDGDGGRAAIAAHPERRGDHRADLRLAGLGDLAFKAIGRRDYPVILGVTMLTGAAVMIVNLLTDVVYALVDPRVSLGG